MPSEAMHWCHACNEPIVLEGRDGACPYCDGRFVEEIVKDQRGQRGSDWRSWLDAGVDFLRGSMARRHPNDDVRERSGSVPVPVTEQGWGVSTSGPNLIVHGQLPGFPLPIGGPVGGPRLEAKLAFRLMLGLGPTRQN